VPGAAVILLGVAAVAAAIPGRVQGYVEGEFVYGLLRWPARWSRWPFSVARK
jgi:hypothetical protein